MKGGNVLSQEGKEQLLRIQEEFTEKLNEHYNNENTDESLKVVIKNIIDDVEKVQNDLKEVINQNKEVSPAPVEPTPAPAPAVVEEPTPVVEAPAPEPIVETQPAPEPIVETQPAPAPVVEEPAPSPVAPAEPTYESENIDENQINMFAEKIKDIRKKTPKKQPYALSFRKIKEDTDEIYKLIALVKVVKGKNNIAFENDADLSQSTDYIAYHKNKLQGKNLKEQIAVLNDANVKGGKRQSRKNRKGGKNNKSRKSRKH